MILRDDKLGLGIDIGSVSVNLALIGAEGKVLEAQYLRHYGQPLVTLRDGLKELLARIPAERIGLVATTGCGGALVAPFLGATQVNEVVAQARAAAVLYPEVRTIIEIGGEDSKLIYLDKDPITEEIVVSDFAMNALCAAGTGSFLDQQAHRLGLSIEAFAELAMQSKNPPRLAGRCSVFAKSDMIHLQQKATPVHDIVAGLTYAMARNFKSTVGAARELLPPIAFQGGVAANQSMVRAFEEILEVPAGSLLIPEHFGSMGAIGAVYIAAEKASLPVFAGLEKLEAFIAAGGSVQEERKSLEALSGPSQVIYRPAEAIAHQPEDGELIPAYLGVDVGSISTNVVVLDANKKVLAKRYLMTAGRPLEAVKTGLAEVGKEVAHLVDIRGVCTTGSGRYLTGDFIGADVVKNEITAQARAAIDIDPTVDTIFEIGGQDSKYVSIDAARVVDFEMNKVCAAGTGSFLEEQAERLGLSIKEEFANLAFTSTSPANLGERCTVFMETELVRHQQNGVPKEDLVAGLAYSIVYNYLNRVVAGRRVGNNIFFQGGVGFNRAVSEAFARVTGKKIIVPPNHEVTGAIGCALMAMENDHGQGSRFKGFDLTRRNYAIESFECEHCSNRCEINKVTVDGESPRHYGSRCGKWEEEAKPIPADLPDLFAEREEMLLHEYCPPSPTNGKERRRVGIPRMLLFYELFPLWKAFFEDLGFEVVLSERTNKRIIHCGCEAAVAETCFPIKLGIGHVSRLSQRKIDYLFLPSIINMPKRDKSLTDSFVCPYVQSFPYTVRSSVELGRNGVKLLEPKIHLERGEDRLVKVLEETGKELGVDKNRIRRAVKVGLKAQEMFLQALQRRGQEVLANLPANRVALVIVARAYNGCDPGANLDIARKLREMGVLAIPMDILPLDAVPLQGDWANMYWRYGQKILAAAEYIAGDPKLNAIYITNFGCGPDSFITRFFRKRMGDKPYLQIEIDEHSADAGVITRLEAFLDSLQAADDRRVAKPQPYRIVNIAKGGKRTVLVPFMSDHAFALKAAFEASGMPADVLPEPDEETLFWGRKYTSGKECFPAIVTTGDMVKFTHRSDFDRNKYAFFMGGSGGPCRFGQYNTLQRMVLDEIGYPDVPIFAPNQASSFYSDMGIVGRKFLALGWQGIVAIDVLSKALRETKPYELKPGEGEAVYKQYLDKICQALKQDANLVPVLEEASKAFAAISVQKTPRRPIIGITGEFYVRSNSFSNQYIVDKLEALGCEVWMAPVYEWFLYRNVRRAMRASIAKDWGLWFKNWAKDKVMVHQEHAFTHPFAKILDNAHEPPTNAVLEMAAPYVHRTFEGEAIMTIGKAIDFINKGLAGVISTMPFTCMPGTISHAILKRVKDEEGGFPFLNMVYDGTEQASTDTRLEAFVYQAKQYLAGKGKKRAGKFRADSSPLAEAAKSGACCEAMPAGKTCDSCASHLQE
jgi:predicted CoA-substrate-specific enzyme activase